MGSQAVAITPDPIAITPDPVDTTLHVGVNRDAPVSAPQTGEGTGFIDRATERFGANLRALPQMLQHPINTLADLVSPPSLQKTAQLAEQYQKDPANLAGDVLTGLIGSTVMGKPPGINMATAGRLPVVERPAPLWQTAGTTPTEPGFNWQGSTPEEIQSHLQRMANRASSSRAAGQPAETPQVQSIPVKPIQPPFPGPKTYDVVRGEDPFTHPNAPPSWKFDQDYSTNVKQYGYHPDSQTLSVQYKRGSVYQFKATQQQFNEMQKAPSAGGYLHDVVEPSQTRGVGRHIGTVQDRSAGQQAKSALEQARGQQ